MSTFYWPTTNDRSRTVCIANMNGTIVAPAWDSPSLFTLSLTNGNLTKKDLSAYTGSSYGFAASWYSSSLSKLLLVPYTSLNVVSIDESADIASYPLPEGSNLLTGITDISGQIYILDVSGACKTYSGGGFIQGSIPSFGAYAFGLQSYSTDFLYSLIPSTLKIGKITLSDSTSATLSTIAITDMTVANSISVSKSNGDVAVCGIKYAEFNNLYDQLSADPVDKFMIGLNLTAGEMHLLADTTTTGIWSSIQAVTNFSAPYYSAWTANGEQIFICDSTSMHIYNISSSVISYHQALGYISVDSVTFLPNSSQAFVCQSGSNLITVLNNSVNTWSASGTISILTAPKYVMPLSIYLAVCANDNQITYLTGSGGTWSVGDSVSIGFEAIFLAKDLFGNIIAMAPGHLAVINSSGTIILYTDSWSGGCKDGFCWNGQLVILDDINAQLRIYNSSYFCISTINTPSGPTAMTIASTGDIIVSCASVSWQLYFKGPYTITGVADGMVFVSKAAGGTESLNLGNFQEPHAIIYMNDGTLRVTTLQNQLFSFDLDYSNMMQTQITTYTNQKQATPLGISSMAVNGSDLYAGTSLSGVVIKI